MYCRSILVIDFQEYLSCSPCCDMTEVGDEQFTPNPMFSAACINNECQNLCFVPCEAGETKSNEGFGKGTIGNGGLFEEQSLELRRIPWMRE